MKNKGFTLIEFIVVLAIIGILSAVLIPNIFSRQQADVDELNNQRVVVDKALNLCYALEGSYPPVKWKDGDWIDYLIIKNYLPSSIQIDKDKYKNYNQSTGTY